MAHDQPLEPTADFATLRQRGLELIQNLAPETWTDHNSHDPGITILEQLCYALTDLSYRSEHPLPDLLSQGGEPAYGSIYSPVEILPTSPVTLGDWRKTLIDVPGVGNAWIDRVEQALASVDSVNNEVSAILPEAGPSTSLNESALCVQGLLRVSLSRSDIVGTDANVIRHQVLQKLYQCRNLGQDFEAIKVLPRQPIGLRATLEIAAGVEPTALLAEVYQSIADYMSPSVPFHSLEVMQQRQPWLDEIFTGPLLQHGFIDSDELAQAQRRTTLYASDLIHRLMELPGISAVKYLRFSEDGQPLQQWSVPIDVDKVAWFKPPGADLDIQLEIKGVALVDHERQKAAVIEFEKLREASATPTPAAAIEQALRPPMGRDRQVANYTSILQQFPQAYGIGAAGLTQSASPERQAMAKQMKAYLMFFDQLLANQFAQLANVGKLFSVDDETADSYFSQVIDDDSLDLDAIRVSSPDEHRKRLRELTEDPASASGEPSGARRRNRFLDHLLARFGQQFHDTALLPLDIDQVDSMTSLEQQACTKRAFLRDYVRIGRDRGTAFNYLEADDENNISGLEHMLAHKLGIASADEKFYLVEHILLRPIPADQQQNGPLLRDTKVHDPYSLQLTLVFPSGPTRYEKTGLVEKMVDEETPAHLTPYVLWLDASDMSTFTAAYNTWQQCWRTYRQAELAGTVDRQAHSIPLRCARDRLIDLVGIGDSYPLSDLNVIADQLKVAHGGTAKIPIEHAQIGVSYQLCDPSGKSLDEACRADGAGATLIIETPKVTEDVSYRIEIIKRPFKNHSQLAPGVRRFLNENAPVKVGLDTSLGVSFAEHQGLGLLDPNGLNPKSSDPRIVGYKEKANIEVQVLQTQEGVIYTLMLDGVVSAQGTNATGNLRDITLSTGRIDEDTLIQVQATKAFPDAGKKDETAVLDATLFLKVRANHELVTAVKSSPIIAFQAGATIVIRATQKSARYRLLTRRIEDSEFVHGDINTQGAKLIQVAVAGKPDVHVQKPALAATWAIPQDYQPLSDAFVSGNGGDLELTLPGLEEDTLVMVEAIKDHEPAAAAAAKSIRSSVALTQAAVVLVKPDPSQALTLHASVVGEATTVDRVTLSNGQPGVFYYLRLKPKGPELPLPVYFHQHDRLESTTNPEQNKGVEQLGVEIDLAIIGDATGASPVIDPATTQPPVPSLELSSVNPPVSVKSVFYVRAQKAQTGVDTQMKKTLTIQPLK